MPSAARPANDAPTPDESRPKKQPAHPRVPAQLEIGPPIESHELEKMIKRLKRWQRQPRAALTWSASAVLIAELRGANHKTSRGYRKAKTLAHDAGLVPPPPGLGEDDLAKRKRRASRVFFYAQIELEEFGAVLREHLNPRDPELLERGIPRCHHALKSRCGCAWNKGVTFRSLFVQTDYELRGLEKAQIARAGLVLVRRPRGALNTPRCTEIAPTLPAPENVPDPSGNTAPGEPAEAAPPRCTENDVSVHSDVGPDLTSRCISLSVSNSLTKTDPPDPLAGSVASRGRREKTQRPSNGRDDVPSAPELLVSTLAAPHGPSDDAEPRIAAPPPPPRTPNSFAAGSADRGESTEGGGARAVPPRPPRPPASAGLAVLAEHRRCLRQDGPPSQLELHLALEALRWFTAAELSECWAGAATSPFNATRALFQSARWILESHTRIQACIDFARSAAASRAAAAAARERMAAALSSAGGERTVAVKFRENADVVAERKAEMARAAQLRFDFDHAGGPARERIAVEYLALVGTGIEADIAGAAS